MARRQGPMQHQGEAVHQAYQPVEPYLLPLIRRDHRACMPQTPPNDLHRYRSPIASPSLVRTRRQLRDLKLTAQDLCLKPLPTSVCHPLPLQPQTEQVPRHSSGTNPDLLQADELCSVITRQDLPSSQRFQAAGPPRSAWSAWHRMGRAHWPVPDAAEPHSQR